ncbi:low-density lipoprotein receptor-related protein 3 [Caerostris extrusa]|uniref:Low-density lipoprotein receptor-related protein 3 n=1 Tax=Caerostris extrusa TaxID=172846 RepID=A0AAV4S735_CAEEX|nr:low-density lipoprotein receptor-related protein 3 [Caerostris extrusa]
MPAQHPDQFKCDNSRCIWAGVTCDGVNNCGDSSDETSAGHPHCPDITPVAITVVVLGITSFIAILVVMCICCCRSESDKSPKLPLIETFPTRPNAGYTPLLDTLLYRDIYMVQWAIHHLSYNLYIHQIY